MEQKPRIFSELFEQGDPSNLQWVLTRRESIREQESHLDDDEFLKRIGRRIPKQGVGDEFTYELTGLRLPAYFSQSLIITDPYSNQQGLSFYFGFSFNPLFESGFAHLAPKRVNKKIAFLARFIQPGDKDYLVNLEFQRISMTDRDGIITEEGKAIIQDFLSISDRLKRIGGLNPDDLRSLEILLDRTKATYEAGKLAPQIWTYGV